MEKNIKLVDFLQNIPNSINKNKSLNEQLFGNLGSSFKSMFRPYLYAIIIMYALLLFLIVLIIYYVKK